MLCKSASFGLPINNEKVPDYVFNKTHPLFFCCCCFLIYLQDISSRFKVVKIIEAKAAFYFPVLSGFDKMYFIIRIIWIIRLC